MFRFVSALIIVVALHVRADTISSPQSANAKILNAATNILKGLRSSQYSHKTDVDVESGRYFCDCSGLGRIILLRASPESLQSLPIEKGFTRPRAVSFYTAFTNSNVTGWARVARVADAQAGDFIAWRRPLIEKGENSGHVMIVLAKPTPSDGGFHVRVMDSSSMPHSEDTRAETQTGIGIGTMWFGVDKSGAPISYRWSDRQRKPKGAAIAVGRALRLTETEK